MKYMAIDKNSRARIKLKDHVCSTICSHCQLLAEYTCSVPALLQDRVQLSSKLGMYVETGGDLRVARIRFRTWYRDYSHGKGLLPAHSNCEWPSVVYWIPASQVTKIVGDPCTFPCFGVVAIRLVA